jgi:putative transposase
MTLARQVVAGRTYFISRRCTQRQFLLRPEPIVEQIYHYCLGEAAQRYDITLHGFNAMSNHQHLMVRDNHANLPDFLAHLNKMIAKAMNALRGRWENFWATEQPNAVYLVEPADRFAKLVYLLANPVADDLVDRVSDWPGACSLGLHLSGRTKTVKRPRVFFRSDGKMPEEVTLRIERPEGFEELSEAEWVAKLGDAIRREEERAREQRRAAGRGVLGRKGVLRVEPTDSPKTVEPRRGLRPHVACLNKARRRSELAALVAFRAKRWAALLRYLEGARDVVFPHGTYRIRGLFLSAPAPLTTSA